MYKVETTINDYKYYETFVSFEEALKYYTKEMKDNVDIENATIKVYRICTNGKEDLLKECNMIAL
jgi:hypothetical protein